MTTTKQAPRGAIPDPHFAKPPYHVEDFPIGSCVCNVHGYNCLQFPNQPGAKFTTHDEAVKIVEAWNGV